MNNPWTCKHEGRTEIRRKKDKLQRITYLRQCMECGGNCSSAIKYSEVGNVNLIADWDTALEEAGKTHADQEAWSKRDVYAAEKKAAEEDWWRRYNAHLRTPEWMAKRRAVLIRDNSQCQAGFLGCTGKATQVHHKDYRHVFNEPLFDLVAVCQSCHEQLHDHMRKERGAA